MQGFTPYEYDGDVEKYEPINYENEDELKKLISTCKPIEIK